MIGAFGMLTPELQARIFPASSMHLLYVISQMSLVLYIFAIGTLFTIMANDTTLMATSLFEWVYRKRSRIPPSTSAVVG
jgi:hypothetical protein